jgi:cobalt-precorrin-5B (C1)-methyltransferase
VSKITLVGHAGKLVKVSAGIFNTHSRFGDARLETLAALAAAEGAGRSLVVRILGMGTAEEASNVMIEAGFGAAFDAAARRAADRSRILSGVPVEVIMLALDGGVLGSSSKATPGDRGE